MNNQSRFDGICDIIRKFTPLPLIQFEINLVNHCNLNCKSCDHISPLSEKWFANVEQFKRDIHRMSELFDGEARYIRLVGGEPLLHPLLTEFFNITRNYFKSASIELWTNGLLLLKMGEDFWRACQRFNILINVTKYPIDVDYKAMEGIATLHNVKLLFFGNGETVSTFNNNAYDLTGLCEPRNSFIACPNANRHITLTQGGNLFTCDKPPHVNIFNKYFDEKLRISKRDYINIHSDIGAEEILKFLAKPIPFCRYCNITERMQEVAWSQSEKKIEEWTFVGMKKN